MQITNHILMIRPADFKFNEQTAVNNKFQQASLQVNVHKQALKEFDDFVILLKNNNVDVIVINDTLKPETPDAIFPNNWISFHSNGDVFLYPMFSENRRLERREDVISTISNRFIINNIIDLSIFEIEHIYLEGTGSVVLDRDNKIAYACLSLRTNKEVLQSFCIQSDYTALVFNATDENGFPIYHTNVMMCIGDTFAVICLDAIPDVEERKNVMLCLSKTDKEIIEISINQMNRFAGNMLQVKNNKSESLLIMSEQAYLSLTETQISILEKHCKLIYIPLYTIEKNGGGSARCMLAEIHLPKR